MHNRYYLSTQTCVTLHYCLIYIYIYMVYVFINSIMLGAVVFDSG